MQCRLKRFFCVCKRSEHAGVDDHRPRNAGEEGKQGLFDRGNVPFYAYVHSAVDVLVSEVSFAVHHGIRLIKSQKKILFFFRDGVFRNEKHRVALVCGAF